MFTFCLLYNTSILLRHAADERNHIAKPVPLTPVSMPSTLLLTFSALSTLLLTDCAHCTTAVHSFYCFGLFNNSVSLYYISFVILHTIMSSKRSAEVHSSPSASKKINETNTPENIQRVVPPGNTGIIHGQETFYIQTNVENVHLVGDIVHPTEAKAKSWSLPKRQKT